MRGWLAKINRLRSAHQQIDPYDRLAQLLSFYKDWQVIRFDQRAADEFERLRELRIRIGTMDLKIAAIALTRRALLLSDNLRDSRLVPGVQVESWLR